MQTSSRQLALGLSLRDEARFENFYGKKNQETVTALKKSASGVGERVVYLSAARGQGCSHLLQACCHYAHQQQLTSVYLPLEQIMTLTLDVLIDLESLSLICVDDLHLLKGRELWQEAIFHLFNRVYDAGGTIIFAADVGPKGLSVMPDLISRVASGLVFHLEPLTDDEKIKALVARAHRRGMTLTEEVGKYILSHCPRHMATLFSALETLDQASLAAQRRLTIPFVKEVLQLK